MKKPSLSIVVPCRNEEKRLSFHGAKGLSAFLGRIEGLTGKVAEMVLEEDGSTDRTAEVIDSFAKADARLRAVHNRGRLGKGGGLVLGVKRSSGSLIVMCDADLPVPADDVAKLVSLLSENDLVIPSRRLSASQVRDIPFLRRFFSSLFNLYVNLLLGIGLSDTQIGVKAFRREAFEKVKPTRFKSYSMDLEMLVRARREGLRVKEMPTRYNNSRETGFNWLTDGPKMLLDVLLMRFSL